jgi:hypothetical protein
MTLIAALLRGGFVLPIGFLITAESQINAALRSSAVLVYYIISQGAVLGRLVLDSCGCEPILINRAFRGKFARDAQRQFRRFRDLSPTD